MSLTSFDMSSTATEGWNGGKENGVFPRFYRGEKNDPIASQEKGVPITKPVDFVKIFQAGEKDNQIEEVNITHQRRWPKHWAAYQNGVEQMESGTSLALLFPANPEAITALNQANVWSVQALASVPDSAGAVLPFLTTWKKKAQDFLALGEAGKGFHAAEKRAEAAEFKALELEDLIKAQAAELAELKASLKTKTKE